MLFIPTSVRPEFAPPPEAVGHDGEKFFVVKPMVAPIGQFCIRLFAGGAILKEVMIQPTLRHSFWDTSGLARRRLKFFRDELLVTLYRTTENEPQVPPVRVSTTNNVIQMLSVRRPWDWPHEDWRAERVGSLSSKWSDFSLVHSGSYYVDRCGAFRSPTFTLLAGCGTANFDAKPGVTVFYQGRCAFVYHAPDATPLIISGFGQPINDAALSPDGSLLLVARNREVSLYCSQTARLLRTLRVPKHKGQARPQAYTKCAWSPDGLTYAVASREGLTVFDHD